MRKGEWSPLALESRAEAVANAERSKKAADQVVGGRIVGAEAAVARRVVVHTVVYFTLRLSMRLHAV